LFSIGLELSRSHAGELSIELENVENVTFFGAIRRWDDAGNPRKSPDPKAAIDAPAVEAKAEEVAPGRWRFPNLPNGTYDLVILTRDRRRIEGFQFAPVREVDPWMSPEKKFDDDAEKTVADMIRRSAHYENAVEPLAMAGDAASIRVLVMLLRDKPTTYADVPDAATIRHEIWQFTWQYGGWRKEKRTKVLDRILIDRNELRTWTWTWNPTLGGIVVGDAPVNLKFGSL